MFGGGTVPSFVSMVRCHFLLACLSQQMKKNWLHKEVDIFMVVSLNVYGCTVKFRVLGPISYDVLYFSRCFVSDTLSMPFDFEITSCVEKS